MLFFWKNNFFARLFLNSTQLVDVWGEGVGRKMQKKNLKAISSKRSDHHTAKKINNGGKCTLEN